MIRRIIRIDEEKCNGCGACAKACHEGAIEMVDGKARLAREDYCDGLGDCLPACPVNAISFEEREALSYDETAVLTAKSMANNKAMNNKVYNNKAVDNDKEHNALPCGCPGTQAKAIVRKECHDTEASTKEISTKELSPTETTVSVESKLMQWPVQIKLMPVSAPYYDGAKLLVAADCTAYAYGNFHNDFIKNNITVIGCPKLDAQDYSEKLAAIIKNNNIKSVTVVRMEVPCCSGIENAVKKALMESGKMIPWRVVVIATDGKIIED